MSAQRKDGQPAKLPQEISDGEWAAIFEAIGKGAASVAAAVREVAPERSAVVITNAIAADVTGLGQRLRAAEAARADMVVGMILQRARDLPVAARYAGEVVGYDINRGDVTALAHIARRFVPGWIDKASDARIQHVGNPDEQAYVFALTFSDAQRLSAAAKRLLVPLLREIKAIQAERAADAAAETIEADDEPERVSIDTLSDDRFQMTAAELQGEW